MSSRLGLLNVKAQVRAVIVLEVQDLLGSLHACLLDKAWAKVMLQKTEVQSRLVSIACKQYNCVALKLILGIKVLHTQQVSGTILGKMPKVQLYELGNSQSCQSTTSVNATAFLCLAVNHSPDSSSV